MSERSFKICVPSCERYITPSDSHELCAHCDRCLALFTEDGSQTSAPRNAGPTAAEAERRLHS